MKVVQDRVLEKPVAEGAVSPFDRSSGPGASSEWREQLRGETKQARTDAPARFEELVRRSPLVVESPQADPSFNGTPSVHQPPPGLSQDELSRRTQENKEYLLKMWREQDPSLSPAALQDHMKLLEKDHNLASVAIQSIRDSGAQLNVRQTAYLLTVYGEAGTVAMGKADFQSISTHDCLTVTRNLTALESGSEVSTLREARAGMSGREAEELAQKLPKYRSYLMDESVSADNEVEDLDREKRFLDSRSTFARMADLGYLPVAEKPGTYELGTVASQLKVGDVLYAPDPKMQEGFSRPAFHAMKVVGRNEAGEYVVFQVDAANPQVPGQLMTLKEVAAALKPETRLDIYRKGV